MHVSLTVRKLASVPRGQRKDGRNAKSLEQDESVAPATAGMEPSGNRSLL